MSDKFVKCFFNSLCLAVLSFSAIHFGWAQTGAKPELVVSTGHSDTVTAIAFNPRYKLLVSGSSDRTLKIWDLENQEVVRTLTGHTDAITSIAFSANGLVLASSGSIEDDHIVFWSVETGEILGVIETEFHNPNLIVFNPANSSLISGGGDNTVRIWDIETGTSKFTLEGHTAPVKSVAVSSDGKFIASASEDKTIKLWNAADGKFLRTLNGSKAEINSVAFSPDGKTLLSGGQDGKTILWNFADGRFIKTLPTKSTLPVSSVAFNPNGAVIASAHDMNLDFSIAETPAPANEDEEKPPSIEIWNAASGAVLPSPEGEMDNISALAFSPDGKTLALAAIDDIAGFDLADLENGGFALSGESYAVNSVAVSPDGRWLAWGGLGSYVNLWNMKNGQEIRTISEYLEETETDTEGETTNPLANYSGVISLAFSSDGKLLAQGDYGGTIRILSLDENKEIRRLKGHSGFVNSVYFGADGKTLVSSSDDNSVKVWNTATGKMIKSIPTGKEDFVYSAAISPDGKTVAYGSSIIGYIKIYNLASGRVSQTIEAHESGVLSLAFLPNGELVSYGKALDRSEEIKKWNITNGTESSMKESDPSKSRLSGYTAFLQNKSHNFQFVRHDARIILRDINSGDELLSLVSFGKFYMPELEKITKSFRSFQNGNISERDVQIDWLVATPDGFFDGTNDAVEKTKWRFSENLFDLAPTEAFFSEFYYPGLFSDVLQGKSPTAPREIAALDRRQPEISFRQPNGAKDSKGYFSTRVQQIQVEIAESPPSAENKLSAGDVRDVRLFRGGSLVHLWRGAAIDELVKNGCQIISGSKETGRKIVCTANVKIEANNNDFTAYAFNRDNIRSSTASMTVSGSPSLKQNGTLYVLAVGLNKYKNSEKDLSYAVADVDAIADGLTKQQAAIKPEQYSKTQIVKLTDENASRSAILAALKRFGDGGVGISLPDDLTATARTELEKIKPAEPEDAIVIYYAGHGAARCENGNCDRFYLIPHDGFPNGEMTDAQWFAAVYKNSISDDDLENALETVDAGKILFVIDACDSGQALEAVEKRRGPMNSRGLAQLAYEKGMYILTAAQSRQAALEVSKLNHGLLTFSLIEGLQKGDKNKDKEIFEREWFDYAAAQVPILQLDAMKRRSAENRGAGNKKKKEITVVTNDDENADPENRGLQTPRVFYRREDASAPFIVAKY